MRVSSRVQPTYFGAMRRQLALQDQGEALVLISVHRTRTMARQTIAGVRHAIGL